jgi:hypothetical protein
MTVRPLVFLDTSAQKHAIRAREVIRRPAGSPTWNIVNEDPAEGVPTGLRTEIDLLSEVAALARKGLVRLATHLESIWELIGTVTLGRKISVFDGIPVERVGSPIPYSRALTSLSPGEGPKALTIEFLAKLAHPRLLELRQACGAHQGNKPAPGNQVVDAFLVWCAEAARADHFLTTDLKLVRTVRACRSVTPRVTVLAPSELLLALRARGGLL